MSFLQKYSGVRHCRYARPASKCGVNFSGYPEAVYSLYNWIPDKKTRE
jgi:hypothetical protein